MSIESVEARYRESREREARISALMNSEGARSVMRWLRDDDNGVTWTEFLREIGGVTHLPEYLTPDGQEADPDKVRPVADRIFARDAVQTLQGGITMTRRPKNR